MNKNMNSLKTIEKNCDNSFLLVRNIFMRSLALIYLFAFVSLYFQIQGLFGEEGLSPVRNLLLEVESKFKSDYIFFKLPTILWFADYFFPLSSQRYENVETLMFILCLIAVLISFSIVTFAMNTFYNKMGFFALWYIYLSFFLVGQNFLDHQWDRLLLEVGFLAIFLVPSRAEDIIEITAINEATWFLLKFLLFRFIFSFGVLQHTSSRFNWQDLTVLSHYFQAQPFPNVFSFLAHNIISDNIKKVLAAFILFLQVYLPFFMTFILPRRLSLFFGICFHFFQLAIICTGSYGFFNLLVITLNLVNFDDSFIRTFIPEFVLRLLDLDPVYNEIQVISTRITKEIKKDTDNKDLTKDRQNNMIMERLEKIRTSETLMGEFMTNTNIISLLFLVCFYFVFPLKDVLSQNTSIYNSNHILSKYILFPLFMNVNIIINYGYIMYRYVYNWMELSYMPLMKPEPPSSSQRVLSIVQKFVFLLFITSYFWLSAHTLYKTTNVKVIPEFEATVNDIHSKTNFFFRRLHIVNTYGMFDKIDGKKGRQELELSVFDDLSKTWENISFKYKVSEVYDIPRISTPHMPRVEYQLNIASKSENINSEGWLVVLLGKVMEKNEVVLDLLGYYTPQRESYHKLSFYNMLSSIFSANKIGPFTSKPTKARIKLWHYSFQDKITPGGFYWRRDQSKNFLEEKDKILINKGLSYYGMKIRENHKAQLSPFLNIPIIDILYLLAMLVFIRKL